MADFGYIRVVKAFDENETAGSFLREDGEGGFAAGIIRMAAEIDRLRAGITAAVEGRYERVPHEHDAAFCRHNLQKKAACLCGSCLRAHLLALLGEPGPEDRT